MGNEEDHKTVTIRIDKISPTLTTAKASNISTTGAKLYIKLNEDGSCRYSDDSDDDTYSEMSNTKSVDKDEETYWSLSGLNDDTDYDYYIICKDNAGNESDIKHIDFTTNKKSSDSSSSSGGSSSEEGSEMLITKPYTPLTDANISSLKATLTQVGFDIANKTLILNNSEIDIQRKIKGTILDDKGNFVFTISIKNKTNKDKSLSIIEIIPKEIASNSSKITFVTKPTTILKEDPIILWQIIVLANKDFNISYKVYSITNSKVISSNQFLRNWQSPVGFTENTSIVAPTPAPQISCPDDNDSCTEEVIENGVCISKNICKVSAMTGKVILSKGNSITYMILYILGGVFAIAMIISGSLGIKKRNRDPMGYGYNAHKFSSIFNFGKRKRL